MPHNSVFPSESQEILKRFRVGIRGKGKAVDVSIANLAGLGIETIYHEGNSKGRLFNEAFLEKRYSRLIYAEVEKCDNFQEEYDLSHIITINENSDELTQSLQAIIDVDNIRKEAFIFHPFEREIKPTINIPEVINPDRKLSILAVGAGGIGNYLALALYDSNHEVTFVDNDSFEESNLNRQIFAEIGDNKAITLAKYSPTFTAIPKRCDINLLNKFNYQQKSYDIILGCVDNTDTRNLLIEYSRKENIPYLDGGVDTSGGQVILNPNKFKKTITEIRQEDTSCANISNPSIVIPNAIIGIQLARSLGVKRNYRFNYNTLSPDRVWEEK